ncbi:MAG TPA: tetratricopeptide repeat protein, partial [Flavisolibacter sp.]|nr:tetratricopeptide repeat protein [Flavisolibacter sp.]
MAAGLLASLHSPAQQEKIDSLKTILPRLKDTARINCLLEIARGYFSVPNKDSITHYSNRGFAEAKRLNYLRGMAVGMMHRSGMAVCFRNDYSGGAQLAGEAIRLFHSSPNKQEIPLAYQILGRAQTELGRYDEALANLHLSMKWAQVTGDDRWIATNLETMTDIYRDRGDYVKLLETQQQLARMDRACGNTDYYSPHELWVLGLTYRLLEEYPTALRFWRKLFVEPIGPEKLVGTLGTWNMTDYADLLTLADLTDSALYYYNTFDSARAETKELRYFLTSKGEYFLHLKQYNTALPYFVDALRYHRQLNDRRQTNRTLIDLAKTYDALHRNDSAIAYARQGLAIAMQTNSKPLIRDGYKILYTVYDRLQQKDSAYLFYR